MPYHICQKWNAVQFWVEWKYQLNRFTGNNWERTVEIVRKGLKAYSTQKNSFVYTPFIHRSKYKDKAINLDCTWTFKNEYSILLITFDQSFLNIKLFSLFMVSVFCDFLIDSFSKLKYNCVAARFISVLSCIVATQFQSRKIFVHCSLLSCLVSFVLDLKGENRYLF